MPIAWKRSSLAAKVSAGPPTITDSVPAAAPCVPPLTGASSIATPFSASCSADAPRGERIDRAHAQHDVALLRRSDDARLAEDHGFGLVGGFDHADRAMASGRRRLGRGFDGRARRDQRLQPCRVDVVHHQLEPGLDEVERHRPAHIAEPDKSHAARHRLPPQLRR